MKLRYSRVKILFISVALSFCFTKVYSQLKLPAVFSDHMVLQQQAEVSVWGWAESSEEISLKAGWSNDRLETVADKDGKWQIMLNTPKAGLGESYSLQIKGTTESITINDVLLGEVWLCSGQSNMVFYLSSSFEGEKEIAKANYPDIRYLDAERQVSPEPQEDIPGSKWAALSPDNVSSYSAVAFYFARKLQKELKVPVGIISAAWGGTAADNWTPENILKNDEKLKIAFERYDKWQADFKSDSIGHHAELEAYENGLIQHKPDLPTSMFIHDRPHRRPASLYNGMINPLKNFNIKGVLWYQGETNRKWNSEYSYLFKSLIENWRKEWGYDFPFYFVQLAPFIGHASQVSKIMEAQLKVYREVEKTGIVTTMDIGNMHDIHPIHKKPVGERLAKWALAKTYGFKNISYSGPLFKKAVKEGDRVRLMFDFTGSGLITKGRPNSFEIVHFKENGTKKPSKPIEPQVKEDELILDVAKLAGPFIIRYGWAEKMENANLFNNEGLPASSFRVLIK